MTIDREKVSFFGLLNNSSRDYCESPFKQIRGLQHLMKATQKPLSIDIRHAILPGFLDKPHKFFWVTIRALHIL